MNTLSDLLGLRIRHRTAEYGPGMISDVSPAEEDVSIKITFDNNRPTSSFLLIKCLEKGLLSFEQQQYSVDEIRNCLVKYNETNASPKDDLPLQKYELNPNNLACCGLLDEYYDLYIDLQQLHLDFAKENEELVNDSLLRGRQIWSYFIRKEAINLMAPVLFDSYPLLGYKIQTEDMLRDNVPFIVFISDFHFRETEEYSEAPARYQDTKFISFKAFLNYLNTFVTECVYRRELREGSLTKADEIFNNINQNILNHAAHCKAEIITKSLPAQEAVTGSPVYVYRALASTKCHREHHDVRPAVYPVKLLNQDAYLRLPIHYCNNCEHYFVGATTLSLFEKNYGKFIVQKKRYSDSDSDFNNMRIESRLHQCGYNVIDGELTETERQALLKSLISSGAFTYFEICSNIEQNIRRFSGTERYTMAVYKWKQDLRYISEEIAESSTATDHNEEDY